MQRICIIFHADVESVLKTGPNHVKKIDFIKPRFLWYFGLRLMDQIKQHLRDFTRSRENRKSQEKSEILHHGASPSSDRRDIEKNHTNFASRIRENPLLGGLWAQMSISWKIA